MPGVPIGREGHAPGGQGEDFPAPPNLAPVQGANAAHDSVSPGLTRGPAFPLLTEGRRRISRDLSMLGLAIIIFAAATQALT